MEHSLLVHWSMCAVSVDVSIVLTGLE